MSQQLKPTSTDTRKWHKIVSGLVFIALLAMASKSFDAYLPKYLNSILAIGAIFLICWLSKFRYCWNISCNETELRISVAHNLFHYYWLDVESDSSNIFRKRMWRAPGKLVPLIDPNEDNVNFSVPEMKLVWMQTNPELLVK